MFKSLILVLALDLYFKMNIKKTSKLFMIAASTMLSVFLLNSCKKEQSVLAIADFSYSTNSTSLPVTVQFINSSIGVSYVWDFGDGKISNETNPTHVYEKYGEYRVKLVAMGTNNIDSMVSNIIIGGTLGQITSLNCSSVLINRTIKTGDVLNQHLVLVPYNGGNGGVYNKQTVQSFGVEGLTASLTDGIFVNGTGNLEYRISGAPQAYGTAKFDLNIGGMNCILNVVVLDSASPKYPSNTVHCDPLNPTLVIEVVNPNTGRIWMDRNLGAKRAAINSTDEESYGDLYQWGRMADGHQCRNSTTTSDISSTDKPTHAKFITSSSDWRNPSNDNLWQGVNGINNPCPSGFRLPTEMEFNAEMSSWGSKNASGAITAPLKFTLTGTRMETSGSIEFVASFANYWTSTINGDGARRAYFDNNTLNGGINNSKARGNTVRCIKD